MVLEIVLVAVGIGGLAYCLATYNREDRVLRRVIRAQNRLSVLATRRGDLAAAHEYKRAELVATNQRIALLERNTREAAAKQAAKGNVRKATKLTSRADILATQYLQVPPPYEISQQQQQQVVAQPQVQAAPNSVHLVANLHPVQQSPASIYSTSSSSFLPRAVANYPTHQPQTPSSTTSSNASAVEWGSHNYYALPAQQTNNTPPNYQQSVYPNYAPLTAYPAIQ